METIASGNFSNVGAVSSRKSLLPTWIKVFGWIFTVMGASVPFILVASIFLDFPVTYMMFGLYYEGPSFAMMPLIICSLIMINGVCAFGLIFGKDWGLNACLYFGYIGLAIVLVTGLASLYDGVGLRVPFEPILQIPYLITLHKIKAKW